MFFSYPFFEAEMGEKSTQLIRNNFTCTRVLNCNSLTFSFQTSHPISLISSLLILLPSSKPPLVVFSPYQISFTPQD